MHTSALPASADLVHTGTLIQDAEVRTRVLDHDGLSVPVLCLELELDNGLRTPLHSEQPFPVGHHKQAAMAAKRYVRGTRVSIQAPLVGVRLVATNTTHIHVIKPTEEAPCPA